MMNGVGCCRCSKLMCSNFRNWYLFHNAVRRTSISPPSTYIMTIRTCISVAKQDEENQWKVRTSIVQQSLGKKMPSNKMTFRVAYIDTAGDMNEEEQSQMPTVLAAPGAPGSHKDLVPLLKTLPDLGARVIVFNFPGYDITVGETEQDEATFTHSNEMRSDFILAFLTKIGINRLDMAVGHSAGTLPLVQLASTQSLIKSLALISPIPGHKPAKPMEPYWFVRRLPRLLDLPVVGAVLRSILGMIGKLIGVGTGNTKHVVAATLTAARFGLNVLPKHACEVQNKKLPLLLVMSQTDKLVEFYKTNEWAEQLGLKRRHFTVYDKQGHMMSQGHTSEGTFRRGVFLQTGGHFPQHKDLTLPIIISHIENLYEHMTKQSFLIKK